MEVQAYIEIKPDGLGGFQFGLVSGQIDSEIVINGTKERFEFTFDGQDEFDPVSGSGWLRLRDEDNIDGRFKFHLGDSSKFLAKRTK